MKDNEYEMMSMEMVSVDGGRGWSAWMVGSSPIEPGLGRNLWNTTVQRTPENMTNDKDIGIFFPRSGTIADSTGCAVKYEEFYVGTKAYLLSGYAERNTSQFLIARCAAKSR